MVAALLAGPGAAGRRRSSPALIATAAKWLLVGRFRVVDHPLWSSFVWRNELADTFVEVLAVPWLVGFGRPAPRCSTAWLRTLGAKIGRGVWLETYWLPESDLVELGDGATVNRGCVVQTHLFHDRIMSMDAGDPRRGRRRSARTASCCPARASARAPRSAPARWSPAATPCPRTRRWLGNPIATWPAHRLADAAMSR